MPKRSSKLRYLNQMTTSTLAWSVVPGDKDDNLYWDKNAAVVELGRLGGNTRGRERTERLSAENRSEIPRRAAKTRWDEF
jgi:hypothetical protein